MWRSSHPIWWRHDRRRAVSPPTSFCSCQCRFCLEAEESICLDCLLYAVSLKSFSFITSLHNWLGTTRTLSTRNKLPGGCSSYCILFPYIEYSLERHIQLFCYVAVAYSSSPRGKSCFVLYGILLESNVHKLTIEERCATNLWV